MFVLLKGATKEQSFKIGQEIAEAVTATNPKPVKLKFEKVKGKYFASSVLGENIVILKKWKDFSGHERSIRIYNGWTVVCCTVPVASSLMPRRPCRRSTAAWTERNIPPITSGCLLACCTGSTRQFEIPVSSIFLEMSPSVLYYVHTIKPLCNLVKKMYAIPWSDFQCINYKPDIYSSASLSTLHDMSMWYMYIWKEKS